MIVYRPSEYSVKKCNLGFARYLSGKQREFIQLGEMRFKITFKMQKYLSPRSLISNDAVSTPLRLPFTLPFLVGQ
jgi:hypothetical protein